MHCMHIVLIFYFENIWRDLISVISYLISILNMMILTWEKIFKTQLRYVTNDWKWLAEFVASRTLSRRNYLFLVNVNLLLKITYLRSQLDLQINHGNHSLHDFDRRWSVASFSSQLTTNILQSFRFITFIFLIDSNIETPLLGVDLCMYSWRISSGPRGRRRIYTSIIISCLDFLFLVTF